MSEKTEKLIKIILPDLLNHLEMVESGEIIEKRQKLENPFDKVNKTYKLEIENTTKKTDENEE